MVGTLRLPLRPVGLALLAGGALIIAATPHPTILGHRSVAQVVVATGGWSAMHYALVVGCFLGLFGAGGIVMVHGDRLGRAGDLALLATTVGLVVTACIMAMEAVLFPTIAVHSPATLDFDGPILGNWALRSVATAAMGFPLGLAALGWLSFREGTYRAAGIALAGTAGAFMALALPFAPYVGPMSTVAFGAAVSWWGWIVSSAAKTCERVPNPGRAHVG